MRCCLAATTVLSMWVLSSVIGCGTASPSACAEEELHPTEEELSRLELAIAQARREFHDSQGMDIGVFAPLMEEAILANRCPEENVAEAVLIAQSVGLEPHLLYMACRIALVESEDEVLNLLVEQFENPEQQESCRMGAILWH